MSDKTIINLLTEIRDRLPLIKSVEKTSEDGRFIDCGDVIKDTWEHTLPNGKKVKLMWQKEDAPTQLDNNGDAEEYCKKSRVGGFDDWRLPEVEELATLADRTKKNPAVSDNVILGLKSDWYWSKTLYADGSGYAWIVGFSTGFVSWDYCGNSYFVRAVRQY